MSDSNSQKFAMRGGKFVRLDGWTLISLFIAALVFIPIAAILWLAFFPQENIWPHLLNTTLPRYFFNTMILMASVGVIAAVIGTTTAWMTTRYKFFMSGFFGWSLLLPLAIPAYVGAYALVDFLEYAGPVQTTLRGFFGWSSSKDYAFIEVRSMGMAAMVLGMALYPYVYLLVRSALSEQSSDSYDVARALGAGPFSRFIRVALPLCRPAIAAGTSIAMMEAASDFGVVDYFAVQTLTTGIFSVWLESYNAGGAAQLSLIVLGLVFILITVERAARQKSRVYSLGKSLRPVPKTDLTGWRNFAAFLTCALPFAIGFLIPFSIIATHAVENLNGWSDGGLMRALLNTLTVAFIAAIITVLAALALVYGARLSGRQLPRLVLPLASIGYAAPGAVLGVGLLIPLAGFDHWIADTIVALGGPDVGLLVTGSACALVLAYVTRFFALGTGAADSAFGRVSPSLPQAARALGKSTTATLGLVYLPLIRNSLGTAFLLIFVDCVKELPATLLLRPFNFNTLATRVYDQASLENLGNAAPAALVIISVGFIAVLILSRKLLAR